MARKFRIGYECDGTFNPDHMDFDTCFGFCHTKVGKKPVCFKMELQLKTIIFLDRFLTLI